MKQKILPLAALIGCAVMSLAPTLPAQAQGRRPSDVLDLAPESATVVGVIDGQTIQVNMNNNTVAVRYIGITAPAPNQCMGAAATNANAALMMGQRVRMEPDALDAAPNGTLLRYVYLLTGPMASEELIKGGYAVATASQPNIKHQGDLNALEAAARSARVGGWSACGWKSSVVVAPGSCVNFTAERISTQGNLPELAMLNNGDCVTIDKATNPVGPEWSGQFIYHPAGTVLKGLSNMYVRWKDAIVMITVDQNGVASAAVVKDIYHPYFSPRWGWDYSPNPGARTTKAEALIPDPGAPNMIEIQNPHTWLFQDLGNGQFKALTDVFLYKSGDLRPIYYAASGYLY
jgi:endonuclease YncB( thermonuclease family)